VVELAAQVRSPLRQRSDHARQVRAVDRTDVRNVLEVSIPPHERGLVLAYVQVATVVLDDALQHGVEKLDVLGLGLKVTHAAPIGTFSGGL
jgi:hypothetical protein